MTSIGKVGSNTGLVFPECEPTQRLLHNNSEPGLYRRKALGASPHGNPLGQKNLLSQLTSKQIIVEDVPRQVQE